MYRSHHQGSLPSPDTQNGSRRNQSRHQPAHSPSPDAKSAHKIQKTLLPHSDATYYVAKTTPNTQYKETPFKHTPAKREYQLRDTTQPRGKYGAVGGRALRWKEVDKDKKKSDLSEARRELSMPESFEISRNGVLGNEELNYLCLLREKQESISELRRLVDGDFSPERQLRQYVKQLKVLQIENQCLMSIISSRQEHLLPNQEQLLRQQIEKLTVQLTTREKEEKSTGTTERQMKSDLQSMRFKYQELEEEYLRVVRMVRNTEESSNQKRSLTIIRQQYKQNIRALAEEFQLRIHEAMQGYEEIIHKIAADIDMLSEKVLKLERDLVNMKKKSEQGQEKDEVQEEKERKLERKLTEIKDIMRQVEENYEQRLRREEQEYQRIAQEGSSSSLNLSGNSLQDALRDAINSRQTEVEAFREQIEEKDKRIEELQEQNSRLKENLTTHSDLTTLAEQLSQHCLKLQTSCAILDSHKCMGGSEGSVVVEDHLYELEVSEEMNRRLNGVKIYYQDIVEELEKGNMVEVEQNIEGELLWLKKNIQDWHQHHYLLTILQQPRPQESDQSKESEPNSLAKMLASLQEFIQQKQEQFKQLQTQIKVAAKALSTQEEELEQRAKAIRELQSQRHELYKQILAKHRDRTLEQKMALQLRDFTRRIDKVAKWQRERRKGVQRVLQGGVGIDGGKLDLEWLIRRGRRQA